MSKQVPATKKRKRGAVSATGKANKRRGKNAIKEDDTPKQSTTEFFEEASDRVERLTHNARRLMAHHTTGASKRRAYLRQAKKLRAKTEQLGDVFLNLDTSLQSFGRSLKSKQGDWPTLKKTVDRDVSAMKEEYKKIHEFLKLEVGVVKEMGSQLQEKVEEMESCLQEMREILTWTTTYSPIFKRKEPAIGLISAPLNTELQMQSLRSMKKNEEDSRMFEEMGKG